MSRYNLKEDEEGMASSAPRRPVCRQAALRREHADGEGVHWCGPEWWHGMYGRWPARRMGRLGEALERLGNGLRKGRQGLH